VDASKDYYAVLGVLPSIEPTALKAVYLALVKKYHPDVYKGSKADAERITKELNQAYGVLGDQAKRAEYDALRNSQTSQGGDFGQEASGDDTETQDNDLERDWKFVVEYHPEAEDLRKELRLISKSLSMLFQYVILTEKATYRSQQIATVLRSEYLKRYFGSNERIQKFVITMLKDKRRDVALEINNVIRVLGTPSEENLDNFLSKILRKFNIIDISNKIYSTEDVIEIYYDMISLNIYGKYYYFCKMNNGKYIGFVYKLNKYFHFEKYEDFKSATKNTINLVLVDSFIKNNLIKDFIKEINSTEIYYYNDK